MSKNLNTGILLDLYGPLLTDKQLDIMRLYYYDDLSLGEIAGDLGISRQAVYDTVKKCEDAVNQYEDKLKIYAERRYYCSQLENIKKYALDILAECQKDGHAEKIKEKTVVLLKNIDAGLDKTISSADTEREDF